MTAHVPLPTTPQPIRPVERRRTEARLLLAETPDDALRDVLHHPIDDADAGAVLEAIAREQGDPS